MTHTTPSTPTRESLLRLCDEVLRSDGTMRHRTIATELKRLLSPKTSEGELINDPKADFVKLDEPSEMNPCRYCGNAAELWELQSNGKALKSVMCSNSGEDQGNEDFNDDEACPLYLPPKNYYAATRREAVEYWNKRNPKTPERNSNHPDECPITGRPFFMEIEHPEHGPVPTYGGPFDSYTIPEVDEDDGQFLCERYDHDEGAWVDGWEGTGLYLAKEEALACNDTRTSQGERSEREHDAKPADHWRVEVYADGESILAIETNCLAGIPNISDHADTVRTCAHHLLAFIGEPEQQPAQGVRVIPDLSELPGEVVRAVAELSDRNSPEDWPEAMLVTGEELSDIIRDKLNDLFAPSPQTEHQRSESVVGVADDEVRELLEAALDVVAWDWSDNDADCVAEIDRLRKIAESLYAKLNGVG